MRRKLGVVVALLAAATAAGYSAPGLWQRWHAASANETASALPLPNAVDIGFSQWISVHHDQAIVMSQILLAHRNTQLGDLAALIQSAQLQESGRMQGWLAYWRQAAAPTSRRMDWMLATGEAPDAAVLHYLAECNAAGGGMPGIASSEELNQLREHDGAEGDRLFLTLMMRHHRGALPMASFAAQYAATPVVRDLARLIVIEQRKELANMQLRMSELVDPHAPAG